jgi:TP53 regulating kinase and related kinases
MKLLQQGAEAKIYLNSSNNIVKDRVKKSYRHPTLDDKIRTRRTKAESKILTKAALAKINVPKILSGIPSIGRTIHMEYIKGDRLSETLNSYSKSKQLSTMKKLGTQIAKLHFNDIIHSDLTTSNTILQNKTNKVFIIDFGLSYISHKIEDKAVDLHLLKQALNAKHYQNSKSLFTAFKSTYKLENSKKILERLKIVESRGRYKH